MEIQIVVFDLWNTLVYDPSREIHEKIAGLLRFENRREFWDYCDKHLFDKNLSFYDFLKEYIKGKNLSEETFDKVKELWEEAREKVNIFPNTIQTLNRLKKRYKMVLLSNTAEREGEEVLTRFKLKQYFDKIVISSLVGLAKPDPKIFQLVLDYFNVSPEDVLVVGDNLGMDIIPARILGMKGILIDTRGRYSKYKEEDWYITSLSELDVVLF
jgi:epoxide hydrolase-like predicted phosphatase